MMTENLYEILGVAGDAAAAEIKAAYRMKVKQTHPDAGGSAEQFRALEHAYRTLMDPEARDLYDRTGESDPKAFGRRLNAARQIIEAYVFTLVDLGEIAVTQVDLKSGFEKTANTTIEGLQKTILASEKKITTGQRILKRLRRVGSQIPGDFMAEAFAKKERELTAERDTAKDQLKVWNIAVDIVGDYEFERELALTYSTGWSFSTNSTNPFFDNGR